MRIPADPATPTEGERLVFHRRNAVQLPLAGLAEPDEAATEATLVQWLEGHFRGRDIPQGDMTRWLARLVSHLVSARGVPGRTLIGWQYPLATAIRAKLDRMRAEVRRT